MASRYPILTEEERGVLILAAQYPDSHHLSNSEIGQRLGIPITRVKSLIHQACIKLNASNRHEAIYLAIKRGEIDMDELLALEEWAQILSPVGPETLREIARFLREKQKPRLHSSNVEQYSPSEKKNCGLLTNRERDVLIYASNGLDNSEIAEKLYISIYAVRTFLNRAFIKLGARKRGDAVVLALKQGEITVDEFSTVDDLVHFLSPLGPEKIERLAQLMVEKPQNTSKDHHV